MGKTVTVRSLAALFGLLVMPMPKLPAITLEHGGFRSGFQPRQGRPNWKAKVRARQREDSRRKKRP